MNQKLENFLDTIGVIRDIIMPYFIGFIIGYCYCSVESINRDLNKINQHIIQNEKTLNSQLSTIDSINNELRNIQRTDSLSR